MDQRTHHLSSGRHQQPRVCDLGRRRHRALLFALLQLALAASGCSFSKRPHECSTRSEQRDCEPGFMCYRGFCVRGGDAGTSTEPVQGDRGGATGARNDAGHSNGAGSKNDGGNMSAPQSGGDQPAPAAGNSSEPNQPPEQPGGSPAPSRDAGSGKPPAGDDEPRDAGGSGPARDAGTSTPPRAGSGGGGAAGTAGKPGPADAGVNPSTDAAVESDACTGACEDSPPDPCANCGADEECCDGRCINTRGSDLNHCGSCTTICNAGTAPACCGGRCVDLRSDQHCGRCNHACGLLNLSGLVCACGELNGTVDCVGLSVAGGTLQLCI